MVRTLKPRRGFTLVELLVVIGIIAVLIGILLPVISRARKQANTTACAATLHSVGQVIYIYAAENKGSLPYGFYRSDAVTSSNPNEVGDADPNSSLYIWWSVLRSYMGRRINADNGADPSGISTSSRGMKGLWCPSALGQPGGVSYTVNMIAMPDLVWESDNLNRSTLNPPIRPAKLNQLYPDNILMWDVTEIGPAYNSQYVVGYRVGGNIFSNPKQAFLRYREMAADPTNLTPGDKKCNEMPIDPGANKEVGGAPMLEGNIRWRHGNNDQANFLFTDGTVRVFTISKGSPGTPNFRGDVKNGWFRIKTPLGYRPRN